MIVAEDPGSRLPFPSARERMTRLSEREVEVVRLIAYGGTDAEVARALHISTRTVHAHVRRAMERAEARHRTHLAVLAVWAGLAPEISAQPGHPFSPGEGS